MTLTKPSKACSSKQAQRALGSELGQIAGDL